MAHPKQTLSSIKSYVAQFGCAELNKTISMHVHNILWAHPHTPLLSPSLPLTFDPFALRDSFDSTIISNVCVIWCVCIKPRTQKWRKIWCLSWLNSLNMAIFSFTHVSANVMTLFIHVISFLHLSFDKHLCWVPNSSLWTVLQWTLMYMQVSLMCWLGILWLNIQECLAGSQDKSVFLFVRNLMVFTNYSCEWIP